MDKINCDLERFMKQMQLNVSTISESIKSSNDDLGRQIRERSDEVKIEIKQLNAKFDEEIKAVKEASKKIEETVRNSNEDNSNRMERMETRLDKMEHENRNILQQKRKRDDILQAEKENTAPMKVQPAGITGKLCDKMKANTDNENMETVKTNEPVYKSTWAKMMSQVSLESQLQAATEAAQRMEDENVSGQESEFKRLERGRKEKKLELGDSLDLHNQSDWPWDSSEKEWDGMIDRKARNKAKKDRDIEKKKKKVEKAVKIGQSTIRIGPIKEASIEYFHNITADFGEAKKMAAAEFLQGYLRFDNKEMGEVNITDTKVSGKDDKILYIVLDSPRKIRDIRRRIADCRNPTIKTRDFIPPLFFDRYSALSRHAAELRSNNRDLKTQIRFVDKDIAIFSKIKGTDDPFSSMDMETLRDELDLPPVDYNVVWKKGNDRKKWRRTSPDTRTVNLQSLGGSKRHLSFQPTRRTSSKKEETPTDSR